MSKDLTSKQKLLHGNHLLENLKHSLQLEHQLTQHSHWHPSQTVYAYAHMLHTHHFMATH